MVQNQGSRQQPARKGAAAKPISTIKQAQATTRLSPAQIKGEFARVRTSLNHRKADVKLLGGRVKELERKAGGMTPAITRLYSMAETTQSRIDDLWGEFKAFGERFNAAGGSGMTPEQAKSYSDEFGRLDRRIGDFYEDLDRKITDLSGRVDKHEERLNDHDEVIQDHELRLSGVEAGNSALIAEAVEKQVRTTTSSTTQLDDRKAIWPLIVAAFAGVIAGYCWWLLAKPAEQIIYVEGADNVGGSMNGQGSISLDSLAYGPVGIGLAALVAFIFTWWVCSFFVGLGRKTQSTTTVQAVGFNAAPPAPVTVPARAGDTQVQPVIKVADATSTTTKLEQKEVASK